jgi:hypothetical protein
MFDEKTPPKEIFLTACEKIASELSGYKFSKSKKEFVKKEGDFVFTIYVYSSMYNQKGLLAEISVSCGIRDAKSKTGYFGDHLSRLSGGVYRDWNLYGKDNYESAIKDIVTMIKEYFIPLTNRFVSDPKALAKEVAQRGFYPNGDYYFDLDFLLKYGDLELLREAIQKDYDLSYKAAKREFQRVVSVVREGGEIDTCSGLWNIARAIVKYDLNIVY